MQVEITKQISQVEIIEVELPYYYKHDLMADYGESIIYGKIEENMSISIQESNNYDGKESYEIEKEGHQSIKDNGLSCYFDKKYESNKKEFEAVKTRLTSFLNDF